MNIQFLIDSAVCTDHQRLSAECQTALETWNEHRDQFCRFPLAGKEAGDELLRLQAKYARAYTVLQNHKRNCPLCRPASRMGEPDSQNSFAPSFENEACT